MRNLEILNLTSDTPLLKIKRSGDLENIYRPLLNLQLSTGEITRFQTDKLNLSTDNPVNIEVQPSYDGSVNLILNDDKNIPLLINSRFSVKEGNTYEIIEHFGTNETNIYSENQLELETRLYKTVTKIPKLDFLGLDINGRMKCGSYHFYFKYSDIDGNETDFITESGVVTCHIGNINDPFSIRMGIQDEDSKKLIKFKLSNVDTQYDILRVYYTRTTSDNSGQHIVTAHYIDSKYVINNQDSLNIIINGFENHIDIALTEINLLYELAGSVKGQTQCQNMLFFGNINKPTIPYKELSDLSLRIIPKLNTFENRIGIGYLDNNYTARDPNKKVEYYDANNIYDYLGYWPEEYYRGGIVYIMNDFTLSPVFNTLGLDFGDSLTPTTYSGYNTFYDGDGTDNGTNNRIYISYNAEGYIDKRVNLFENSKGVIKLPKEQVISCSDTIKDVKPLGVVFQFTNELKIELKKYTRGFFFVRQERIPTIYAQGCGISKTKDKFGNIPVLPIKSDGSLIGITEGFLKSSTKDILNDPYILKTWTWIYPSKYAGGITTIIGLSDSTVDNFIPLQPLDMYNADLYGGASVSNKYRIKDNIGNALYGYWNIPTLSDDAKLQDINNTYGSDFPKLDGERINIPLENIENKAAIIPEASIKESLFNLLFTSNNYVITEAIEQGGDIDNRADWNHYSIDRKNTSTSTTEKSVLLTLVTDDTKLTTNGVDYFAARAGEAEQVWDVIDVEKDWTKPNPSGNNLTKGNINPYLTQSKTLVRGSYGTYVGIGNGTITPGTIFNVRPDGYNSSILYTTNMFELRITDSSPYQAISDRIDWNNIDTNITCYRGDCYIGNFTHRMHRNFIDPEINVNSKIVDPMTWYKGFAVKQEYADANNATNKVLLTYKRDAKGNILVPTDSNYANAGQALLSVFTDNYTVTGADKINRADINAIPLGHWFTFKVMANNNLSMRDIDVSNITEQSIFNKSRSFYPLHPLDKNEKLTESKILNGANNITLSKRYNFNSPDVPFIKNNFDTRILYSNIHITDAFKNGYRVFTGGHYRDYTKTYGGIVDLKEWYGSLFVTMEHGCLLIPVNERAVAAEGQGGLAYINTSNVLPENPRVISDLYGSIWQESIIKTKTGIYGIDTVAKKIWCASPDGNGSLSHINISDLKVQRFLNENIDLKESDKKSICGLRNIKTHYNKNKGDIIFTFYNYNKEWSLCYNENLKKFITFYSWTPSHSTNINNVFFSLNKKDTLDILNSTNLSIKLWKHGQSGIYNNQGVIKPTTWYDHIEPFEFEFVVTELPIIQKVFNNLKLISNKAEPDSFEFEVVGETYDWYEIKDLIVWINEKVKNAKNTDSDYSNFSILSIAYKYILNLKLSEIEVIYPEFIRPFKKQEIEFDNYKFPKLPYLNRIRYSDTSKWESNSTNVELREDKLLTEDRIHTQQLGNNIKKYGRVKGNMMYLEDFWDVEIRPITFKYAYLKQGNLEFTNDKATRIRDKYMKVRVKYSGKDLAIIQGIKTAFTPSFA